MGIAERLKEVVEGTGMNVTQTAERCGIPYRSMQNYLRGEREPNAEALVLLSTHLGISVDWLLTGEGPMRRGEAVAVAAAVELTRRERIALELFQALTEEDQTEIISVSAEKKRLREVEARLEVMQAELALLRRPA